MQAKASQSARERKAAIVSFLAMSLLLAGGSRCPAEEPPAKTTSVDSPDAIAKDIEKTVLALGYPKTTSDDLVLLVRGWKCEQWKQKLSQARTTLSKDAAAVAGVETETTNALLDTIGSEFIADHGSQYFYLPKVLKEKKANSLGYSQLLYIVGNGVGLKVAVLNVLELASGPLPVGESLVACSVSLSDGSMIIVDVAQKFMSKPFVFKDTFTEVGTAWERKQKDNLLPTRIQFSDENGLVGIIYNSLADEYARARHPKEAIDLCTKAIELNPRFADAYIRRGAYYNATGQPAQAIPDFTKAIALNPTYAFAYVIRGIAYSQSGEAQKALADLTKAIELNPKMAEGFIGRGTVYDALEQYPKAIADYGRAIELNPKMAQAYFNRGVTYGKSGQAQKALTDFDKVIDLEPKAAQAYFMRGVANASLKKVDDAKIDLRKALELNPGLKAEVKKVSSQYKLGL